MYKFKCLFFSVLIKMCVYFLHLEYILLAFIQEIHTDFKKQLVALRFLKALFIVNFIFNH